MTCLESAQDRLRYCKKTAERDGGVHVSSRSVIRVFAIAWTGDERGPGWVYRMYVV